MNIQRGTIVDRLYRNREYRPLGCGHWWRCLRGPTMTSPSPAPASSSTQTPGGRPRGAHNCGSCDADVGAAIERYSVSADIREFANLDCQCRGVWRAEVHSDLYLPAPMGTGRDRRGLAVDLCRAP
ncbi:MAG: hypothetical protein CM1200mP32_06730 [Methanobacteriota archaeon]|nr:MAG: hypothetical protein CM1200mP32_06730 [Euryarchaeota archaeon]